MGVYGLWCRVLCAACVVVCGVRGAGAVRGCSVAQWFVVCS